eukprot:353850-Chlamydomonas_euryale.AAC.1
MAAPASKEKRGEPGIEQMLGGGGRRGGSWGGSSGERNVANLNTWVQGLGFRVPAAAGASAEGASAAGASAAGASAAGTTTAPRSSIIHRKRATAKRPSQRQPQGICMARGNGNMTTSGYCASPLPCNAAPQQREFGVHSERPVVVVVIIVAAAGRRGRRRKRRGVAARHKLREALCDRPTCAAAHVEHGRRCGDEGRMIRSVKDPRSVRPGVGLLRLQRTTTGFPFPAFSTRIDHNTTRP